MSSAPDGGPAFPQPLTLAPNGQLTNPDDGYGVGGMRLRDYFAAKAMAGMLGNQAVDMWPSHLAEHAYKYADAMITQSIGPDPRIEAALDLLKAVKAGLGFIQRHHDDYEGTAPDDMKAAIEKAEAAGLKV